jgi:hypothetical protein
MDNMEFAFGFGLYFIASVVAGVFVAPYAAFLVQYLSWAGAFTSYLFGAIISFPILVLMFYLANRGGVDAAIPEVS